MTGNEPTLTPEPAPAPAPDPTPEPAAPEPAPTEPAAEPAPTEPAPADRTVNASKHYRDVAKLKAERDAAKAEAEGLKGLRAEFEAWKAEQEAARNTAALKDAGCHDVVAASARLAEFDGDVAKLKEAAPYLFSSSDKSKSTGGAPKGAPSPEDERTKRMRGVFGLDEKE